MMFASLDLIYRKYNESTGVSTDTRSLEEGNIFFALRGPSFNGNQYAQRALEAGASSVVIDEPEYQSGKDCLLVEDTLQSLQQLAQLHRRTFSIPLLGITGSNGKTTTKELIKFVLSNRYKVYATEGNYNNHIGVPLTLLKMTEELEFCIVEMGTNQPGDIAELCVIAEPNYALITNIGDAHLEKLISRRGVYEEKSSLFESVEMRHGAQHVFLNMSDEYLRKRQNSNAALPYIQYDAQGKYSSSLKLSVKEGHQYLRLDVNINGEAYELNSQLTGSYNVENVAAAITVGIHFGIEIEEIIDSIESYRPQNMRSEFIEGERNLILLDAYNANPTSMMSSISSFIKQNDPSRTILILGDMLELGDEALAFHRDILKFIERQSLSNVFLIGEIFLELSSEFPYSFYRDAEEMKALGLLQSIQDKTILIKGSRGIKLEKIIDQL